MPRGAGRGRKGTHKGKSRHFTSEEELKAISNKEAKEREWRRQQGIPSDSEESGDEKKEAGAAAPKSQVDDSDSDSGSGSDVEEKNKGVSHLIEVSNPNHAASMNKMKKVTTLTDADGPALSRREREELQKQQAAMHYRKLHNEGKTDEARADLARLAIIRKQREEAAKKKAEDAKEKTAVTSAAEQKLLDRKKAAKK